MPNANDSTTVIPVSSPVAAWGLSGAPVALHGADTSPELALLAGASFAAVLATAARTAR